MNINSKLSFVIGALCFSFLFVSCNEERFSIRNAHSGGELVPVKIDLHMGPLVELTSPLTKGPAINATTNKEVNTIKNLWILQFKGTDDTSELITSNIIYIENYNPSDILKLVASSVDNRLVFIANTFAKTVAFGDCNTLADVKKMMRTVEVEDDAVHSEYLPGGVIEHYPIMNGYQDVTVTSGITVGGTLKHNVARIDVKLVNTIPSFLTIEKISIKDVPNKYHYITDYTLPSLYPEMLSLDVIDYQPTDWEDGEAEAGDSNTRNFSFYIPANKRGSTTEDTQNGKYKGFFAPEKATRLYITASYMDNSIKRSVSYTFYLGADLVSDYNIEPNGHYSYTITINNKGDEGADGRVDDSGGVIDFCDKALANCYIINPPKVEGSWRNYRIPVKRVWDFWKEDGKYEDNNGYALLNTSEGWVMDVIWSEFPITDDTFKWVKKNRIKSEGLNPESDYFEFQIKEGVRGNCVVGIRRYTNSTLQIDDFYLWSWHLWVTDYKPDEISRYTVDPSEGRYVYKVPGGSVHRYDNPMFNTGIYAGKVIMDRNLGSKDIYYHGDDGREGVLFYVHGRKDPFVGPRNIYIRHDQGDGSSVFQYEKWNTSTYCKPNTTDVVNGNNVPYAIHHPMVFITGTYPYAWWTLNDIYSVATNPYIRWKDPYVTDDFGKSIFDPCPTGWKVPSTGTWNNFDTKENDMYTKFLWNDPLSKGRNYFPNTSTDRSTGTIFFPDYGHLNNSSGYFFAPDNGSMYMIDMPLGTTNAFFFIFTRTKINNEQQFGNNNGLTVRCVQVPTRNN